MSRMGTFYTTILVESHTRRGETLTVENVLVDTGSEFTWVPRQVLEELGIRPERLQRIVTAEGRQIERSLGYGIVHAAGSASSDDLIFAEPGDLLLLGARTLEGMNLRVDPRLKQLVPSGPALAATPRAI
jgi:predicted aspartyl protease